jgi:hypothetical protein
MSKHSIECMSKHSIECMSKHSIECMSKHSIECMSKHSIVDSYGLHCGGKCFINVSNSRYNPIWKLIIYKPSSENNVGGMVSNEQFTVP